METDGTDDGSMDGSPDTDGRVEGTREGCEDSDGEFDGLNDGLDDSEGLAVGVKMGSVGSNDKDGLEVGPADIEGGNEYGRTYLIEPSKSLSGKEVQP